MAFEEGDAVEVSIARNEKHYAWYPATVMSADANALYTVRYDLLLTANAMEEQVHAEDVRPRPPFYSLRKRDWIVGEDTEVLDSHSWRAARVKKILGEGQFLLQLIGSIMIRRYHMRYLRVPQVWENGCWKTPSLYKSSLFTQLKVCGGNKENSCEPVPRCHAEKCIVRRPLLDDDQMSSTDPKRKASSVDSLPESNNGDLKKIRTSGGYGDEDDDHACERECMHKFQMAAYELSLQALLESGPLTWEKEALLTKLRITLSISNEEHLLLLTKLLGSCKQ